MMRLAEIAAIVTGVAPVAARGDGIPFVQIKDLAPGQRALVIGRPPTAKRALPIAEGDILVAARGERSAAVRADSGLFGAYVTPDVYLVRPDPRKVDADYLAAWLNRPAVRAALRTSTAGAALPRIPKEALARLEVPVPGLDRQRLIGGLAEAILRHDEIAARLARARAHLLDRQLDRAFMRETQGNA